jgi:DNA-binding HxlR family transcriptional regulator
MRTPALRFSELRRACPPISDRILSRELKELEAAGLLRREQRSGQPLRTDYELTEVGATLKPVIAAMADWSLQNRAAIEVG